MMQFADKKFVMKGFAEWNIDSKVKEEEMELKGK